MPATRGSRSLALRELSPDPTVVATAAAMRSTWLANRLGKPAAAASGVALADGVALGSAAGVAASDAGALLGAGAGVVSAMAGLMLPASMTAARAAPQRAFTL